MRNKQKILGGCSTPKKAVLLVLTLVTSAVHFGADVRPRVATLLYVNFLFVVFGFPLASRLVLILHIYIYAHLARAKRIVTF